MRLLLDTHSFLWFIDGNAQLSPMARQLIEDQANQPLLSIASLWEIAIKVSLGKLALRQPFRELMQRQLRSNGIDVLDIAVEHLAQIPLLPFHHRDPFDRLLVAQSLVEHLPIVSVDEAFDAYAVQRLW